jgi:hypothetical protein
MSTWVAALVAATAITLTYFFCVRPMMRGRGGCAMPGCAPVRQQGDGDSEVAQLREEIRALRAQDRLDQRPPADD